LDPGEGGLVEHSEADTAALIEERARRLLGMSGEEFLRRWRAGEFEAQEEREDIWQVAILLGGAYAPR
jgi:hypothetical protein